VRAVLALVVLLGCDDPEPVVLNPGGTNWVRTPVKLPPWQGNRALPKLPDAAAKNESYLAAVKAWHTATTAYARGDAVRAAESFLDSARKLKSEGEPEPIARTFTAGRCLGYENAARAWATVRRLSEAQAKLTPLEQADPGCKHSIENALTRAKDEMARTPLAPMWRKF
jgi:hypothetical protein